MIRNDVVQAFPELFGVKTVNGRELDVDQTISSLTRELEPAIAAVLTARRELLASTAPVRTRYAWPQWDQTFHDPISGKDCTFRHIVEGLLDNFHGRNTQLAWRLNDQVAVPTDANPLTNPGLELTGHYCPATGRLLAVDIHERGVAPVDDIELDLVSLDARTDDSPPPERTDDAG